MATGSNSNVSNGQASDPESTTPAPGYVVVDAKATWKLTPVPGSLRGSREPVQLHPDGLPAGDDPHFWDSQGNYGTSHIWGPLRGRQLYVGLRLKT